MVMMIIAVIILAIGLFNMKKINDMFNKPSAEELESYQEAVFIHIDEEVSKYKKELSIYYDEKGKPLVNDIQDLIDTLDSRIKECREIEERLDEKIIKLSDFKHLLG